MYVSLQYRLEEIEIYNLPITASQALELEQGSRTKSVITPSFVFDNRDSTFFSHRGERLIFTPFVAGGPLGGNTQDFGFDLEGSQYFHLPYDLILLLNGEIAGVDTWGSGDRVPIYDRLFLGGANNLRGFAFRDLGPRDPSGEPLGGHSLARATIELTFPIIEKFRGAVFYDTGFVNEGAFDYNLHNVASDVGVGVRLHLPVGPMRIDYGIPIEKAGTHGGGRFNFNVGYQF
jgi:outer membrane protein insertion porin family